MFSLSDAVQNSWCWMQGKYKRELGETWTLPFEQSSFSDVFFRNLYRQPEPRALQASLMTAWHGALPTIFVALFGSLSLLQLTYLRWGPTGMARLTTMHPHLVRWATYQSLLVVAINQYAVFLVTLVVHKQMGLKLVAFYNALIPLMPLLNMVAFCLRYPGWSFSSMVRALV